MGTSSINVGASTFDGKSNELLTYCFLFRVRSSSSDLFFSQVIGDTLSSVYIQREQVIQCDRSAKLWRSLCSKTDHP